MATESAGSARLALAANVVPLDPAPAMVEAMLGGWRRQQAARLLRNRTIGPRLRMIQRMQEFSGLYPWQWTPAEGEAFIDHLRGGERPIRVATARHYEVIINLFMEFVLDPRYGWAAACAERFGQTPQLVFHDGNSVQHKVEYEGRPGRRPLTYDEVQALFDAADARPSQFSDRGVKGALNAARDAAALKLIYAFGLRRTEASRLDVVDLGRNPRAPQFGRLGCVMVRYGKASAGSAPKRRTVLLVPEMDWIVETLDEWITDLRPRFAPGRHPALWLTERVSRLSPRSINDAFAVARVAAGLDPELTPHCLRHSYVTHLTEFGYPARFIQEQVGHEHAATTSTYMNVSNEYRNTLLEDVLRRRIGAAWETQR